MLKQINYGIIGAGHLGTYHAQQIQNIPGATLVGVFDISNENAKKLSKKYKIDAFSNLQNLLDTCNAVSITTPASNHFQSAMLAMKNNCHVFIEKPITKNVLEASKLIKYKNVKKLKMQIGHIERFNPAFTALLKISPKPKFIEFHRLCAFNKRGLDVDVVLDLMIHDLDLLSILIPSPIKTISAYGAPVLTKSIDMASARIEFQTGEAANLTASRISLKQMRQMRVFQKNSYSVVDFQSQKLNTWKVDSQQKLESVNHKTTINNALFEELNHFIYSIQHNILEKVRGEDGFNALKTASKIQKKIAKKQ